MDDFLHARLPRGFYSAEDLGSTDDELILEMVHSMEKAPVGEARRSKCATAEKMFRMLEVSSQSEVQPFEFGAVCGCGRNDGGELWLRRRALTG